MAIAYPPVIINEYLAEKVPSTLPNRFRTEVYGDAARSFMFFPTLPTDISALTETFPVVADNVFAVYDRMFRMRRTPFPHIKDEQLMYYFYKINGKDPDALFETTQVVNDLLDRGDESAEEINAWVRARMEADPENKLMFGTGDFEKEFKPVYFHQVRVYQLEEVQDIIDFGTARTYAGNKIIIDYRYHIPTDVNNDPQYNLFPS